MKLRIESRNLLMGNDGWEYNSEIRVGLKILYAYIRGNELKIVDRKTGEIKYNGDVPDLLAKDRYKRMIEIMKEAGKGKA